MRIATELVLFLPKRAKFITSIFKGDHISEFSVEKQHLWVEILSKSFEEELKFHRGSPLGFVVIGPEYLKFNHETQTTTKKKNKKKTNSLLSTQFWFKPNKKNQLGGSLNRYMVLPTHADTKLIKPPKVPLVLSKLLPTISTILQKKEQIKLSAK